MAQTPSAADGPWSGWVRCELSAQLNEQGRTYLNQQTHTWELTSATPISGTDIKEYPATWTVVGGGTGQRQEGNGRTVADKWTTSGQPMPTTISFRVDLMGGLVIALRGAQLVSVSAMTGQSVAHSINGNAPDQQTSTRLNVEEYRFPLIQDDARKTSIVNSSPPVTVGNIAPGQPPRTVSTAACSWNFVRGGQAPPPPSSGRSITREQAAPLSPVSGLNLPGTPTQPATTTFPGGTATAGPPAPTPTFPGGTATAGPPATTTFPGGSATATPAPRTPTPVLIGIAHSNHLEVTFEWRMPTAYANYTQWPTGFLVQGAGLPPEGRTRGLGGYKYDPVWGWITISNLPAGNQSWVVTPYWGSPNGLDTSTGLRVSATIAPWTNTPGQPPTGVRVQPAINHDIVAGTCQVSILVTWSPVPGATAYTVSDGTVPLVTMPLTTYPYIYRKDRMKLTDVVSSSMLAALYEAFQSQYSNQPQFRRGVSISVAAHFPDRPAGVSAPVPSAFSIFPCSDGRNFPSDP